MANRTLSPKATDQEAKNYFDSMIEMEGITQQEATAKYEAWKKKKEQKDSKPEPKREKSLYEWAKEKKSGSKDS